MDHSVTTRSTHERIKAENQGGLGIAPTKEGMLEFFRSLMRPLGVVPAGAPA
jgi:hypothetical protein